MAEISNVAFLVYFGIPKNLTEFPCFSRIFKPNFGRNFTSQIKEKNYKVSKPTEQGSNSQIFGSYPIVNYISQVPAKMASVSTENNSFRRFWWTKLVMNSRKSYVLFWSFEGYEHIVKICSIESWLFSITIYRSVEVILTMEIA